MVQRQTGNSKTPVIILCAIIAVPVLTGSCGAFVMYLNAQKEAEEEKRGLQKNKEEVKRKAEQEAARKTYEERIARAAEAKANKTREQVISVNKVTDREFVNVEADVGYRVTAVIENVGVDGDLQIVIFLSCSQGEWSRTQHLYFNAGQSMP